VSNVEGERQGEGENVKIPQVATAQDDLFAVVARDARGRLAELLRSDPALARTTRADGATPLHLAAARGYAEAMGILLAAGADVASRDRAGQMPLHAMVDRCARADVAALLLNAGAEIDARDARGHTPVALAARFIHRSQGWADHAGLAAFLLDRGASLDAWTATILGRDADLAALLEADPTLANSREPDGTPMGMGLTPLHHAAERGYPGVARVLLDHRADVGAVDGRGRPPLYLAAQRARLRKMRPSPDVVDLLVARGAPLDACALAVLGRTDELAASIAADPAKAHARDAGGHTPLHLAAWNGQAATVALLLDAGAEIDARNGRGETPLALAAVYENEDGMAEVIDLLLERGARADVFTAVRLPLVAALAALLDADPGLALARNRYGRTPARYAVEKGLWIPIGTRWGRHWDAIDLLVARGAAVESTAWTAAALGRDDDLAALLRADPRLANASGGSALTPLHWAAHRGHRGAVMLLLRHEADIQATDPYVGKTPAQWAEDNDHRDIAALLRDGRWRDRAGGRGQGANQEGE